MAAVDLQCMTPQCDGLAEWRGLCCSCYAVCKQNIDSGETNWRELERGGVCHSNSKPMTDAINAIKGRKPAETVYEVEQVVVAQGESYDDPSYLKRQLADRNATISQLRHKVKYLELPHPEAVAALSLKLDEATSELKKKQRELAATKLELNDFRKETQQRVDSLGEQVLRHIKTIESLTAEKKGIQELYWGMIKTHDTNIEAMIEAKRMLEEARNEIVERAKFYSHLEQEVSTLKQWQTDAMHRHPDLF